VNDQSWEEMKVLYVRQARADLAGCRERLGPDVLGKAAIQEIRIVIHRLRGTGTSYGLPWLTEGCAVVDEELARVLRDQEAESLEAVHRWRQAVRQMALRLDAGNTE
jgi:hypothetical protein